MQILYSIQIKKQNWIDNKQKPTFAVMAKLKYGGKKNDNKLLKLHVAWKLQEIINILMPGKINSNSCDSKSMLAITCSSNGKKLL